MTILCPNVAAGDTGTVNGVLYTKIDAREDLIEYSPSNGTVNADVACTSDVTNMASWFNGRYNFNEDISHWDVASVTTMQSMFYNATSNTSIFNSDLSKWDVSSVRNFQYTFSGAESFNADISGWDVSKANDMRGMFAHADAFNVDISGWNTRLVSEMNGMFQGANIFNQDIGNWNVSLVINMSGMFFGAGSFNQDLSDWCVPNIDEEPSSFSQSSPLSRANKPQWGRCPVRKLTPTEPSNEAINQSITPTLSWIGDDRASSYEVIVSTDNFSTYTINETTTSTSFDITSELEYSTDYSWVVRGSNTTGDGDTGPWSDDQSFTTQSLPPVELSIPDTTGDEGDTLVIPVITSDLSGKNITAIDIDITHDTSMVEIVSVNRSETIFSNVVTVTNLVGNSYRIGGSSSSEINGSGVLIYIHVFLEKDGTSTLELNSTLNEGEVSANSTNGTITIIDTSPPDAPSLTTPSDGADDIQLSPTLEWSSVSGATSYSVEISSDNFSSSQTYSTSSTSQEVGPLTYETSYSWRVKSSNENGESGWSDTRTFTTQVEPVEQITLSSPSDESTGVTLTPTLSWSEDSNSDSYTLQVSTDGFESFVVNESLTETSFTTPELEYNTTYSWRVRGTNSSGDGDYSEVWTFTTQVEPVEQITLSSPSDESTGVTLTPTLSWSEDSNSDSYTLQVSTDGFESFVVNESLTETSFTTPELEYNTTYSWRVRGTNSSGDGDYSEVWSFTTFSQLQTPTLLNPRNGQLDVGTVTDFDWSDIENALGYNLEVSTASDMNTIVFKSDTISTSDYIMTESLAQNQLHYWRVKALSNNSMQSSEWSKIQSFGTGVRTNTEYDVVPTDYSLNQNYPNPFNPTTTITYSLPQSGMVKLNVYDITGRFITTLVDGVKGVGTHTVQFEGSSLSSGMYVYTLETDGYRQTRQMMLVK